MLVDVLLTFQQFQSVVENPSMYMLPDEMAFLFEEGVAIPLSDIPTKTLNAITITVGVYWLYVRLLHVYSFRC